MSKQIIHGIIFVLLLIGTPAIAQKAKIKKARNLIEALDYNAAEDILLSLANDGDNAEVAVLLGTIFRKQNSYNRAAVWYQRAVQIPDVEASAYFYYGMMLLNINKCREAQEQFDYFFSLKPLDPRQFQLKNACAYREYLLQKQKDSLEVQALSINSVLSDIGPAFYRSGLVFGSVRADLNNQEGKSSPFYDLYYAPKVGGNFDFGQPESFSDRINTRVHEAIVTFSQDESKIYFTRNQVVDKEHSSAKATGLEIVFAVSEDGNRWDDLQLLPFNSPKYSIAHPSLSPDQQMLFFSSDMPGGFGGKDIYVSEWETDHWGAPVNLGPLVNSEGDEMFPSYHSSGKLYFSSDGQVGLGGHDIFMTEPNKAGVWANVENLGAPINTEFDDYGIIVAEDESHGYFTSDRANGVGKDDIYGFQKPQDEPELVVQNDPAKDNKVVIHVQLLDAASGQRIENPEVSNCEANLYRSVGTSSFQLNLYPGDCCEIEVTAAGYQSKKVEVCGDPANKTKAISLEKLQNTIASAPKQEDLAKNEPGTSKTIAAEPQQEEVVTKSEPTPTETIIPEPQQEEVVAISEPAPPETIIPEPKQEEVVAKSEPAPSETIIPEPQQEEVVAKSEPAPPETIIPEPQQEEVVAKSEPAPPETIIPEPKQEEVVAKSEPAPPETVIPEPKQEEIVVKSEPAPPETIIPEPTPERDTPVTVVRNIQEVPLETNTLPEEKIPTRANTSGPSTPKGEQLPSVADESTPPAVNTPIKQTEVYKEETNIIKTRKTTKYLIGTVYDPLNSRPIPFATIHLLNSTCGVNLKIQSDESGHYRLPLISNCCINIRVEKPGFQTYTALEALCTDKAGNVKGSTSILLKPETTEVTSEATKLLNRGAFDGFERSKNTKLGDASLAFILNVYYDTERTSVKEESVEDLKKLLVLLEENPTMIVEIGAHTDSRGSDDYNADLSQRRAENVVKYLVSQGIYKNRLVAKGYGESQLINDCDDHQDCEESQHQVNRRTEFRVIGNL